MHQQRELCQLSVAAVKCMGFTVGVFHVECKYTSTNGPQLIEVLALATCPPKAINTCMPVCVNNWQEHRVDANAEASPVSISRMPCRMSRLLCSHALLQAVPQVEEAKVCMA